MEVPGHRYVYGNQQVEGHDVWTSPGQLDNAGDDMSGMRRNIGRILCGTVLALTATLALAAGSGPISGHNGHGASLLFDDDDVRAIPTGAWDRDWVWFGDAYGFRAGRHTITADGSGTAYVIVQAQDANENSTWVAGVVKGTTTSSPQTVYQYAYDSAQDYEIPYGIALAPNAIGTGSTRIDAGDVVLLSDAVTGDGTSERNLGTLIQAVDPDDAAATLRTVYSTNTWLGRDLILDVANGRLLVTRGRYITRVEHASGSWSATTEDVAALDGGGSVFAIDDEGDLYADSEGGPNAYIARIDTTSWTVSDATWANPKGAGASYANHDIQGLTFDRLGNFWIADFNPKKSSSHFITKRNKKGKFPYKKRIAGWNKPDQMRTLQTGADGRFYAIMRNHSNETSGYGVYAID